ncbi:MAG: trimethylamine methyltransferase family protein [Desulfosporosinus sp.]|nr:trimethylamine methyltransferase family protein [Desulfosporosinus sp.]
MGKMFACFEYGVPVVYTPGVLSGATTPVTKAGTIVLMNAEALAGVVMAQLKQRELRLSSAAVLLLWI